MKSSKSASDPQASSEIANDVKPLVKVKYYKHELINKYISTHMFIIVIVLFVNREKILHQAQTMKGQKHQIQR